MVESYLLNLNYDFAIRRFAKFYNPGTFLPLLIWNMPFKKPYYILNKKSRDDQGY